MADETVECVYAPEPIELPDGRTVRIRAYSDGSVRFRLDGTPYVITEAYLSGRPEDHAIVKLSPGKQGSAAAYNWMEEKLKAKAAR
ncbi:hypothetical protein [Streptomyces sp. NPDC007264]|uniref:hypothetical protein n=1 Tax=Streptomyces sp. NPDC007264 TaxID=3364777 RepID=UPI0036DB3668